MKMARTKAARQVNDILYFREQMGAEQLLEYQKTVDDKIVYILHRMAIYIELEDKTDYTGSCFDELDAMLVNLKKEALRYMNNHLIAEDDYYYEYMQISFV